MLPQMIGHIHATGDFVLRSMLISMLCNEIEPDDVNLYISGLKTAIKCVQNVPSVDAVIVVRCKNCAYKDVPQCCPYQLHGAKVADEWFCPMGVRGNIYG